MTEIATLCFIQERGKVLLIHKKRGFGEGKFNGPGGKVLQNEELHAAVVRELEEEIGIRPQLLSDHGYLLFYNKKDPQWKVYLFGSNAFEGNLIESEEASPHWFELDKIPFDKMWPDDVYWLPHVLFGKNVVGKFHYDTEWTKILSYELTIS